MHSQRRDQKTDAKPTLSGWMALYKRFSTYKAARCEVVTMKSVGWYLLPLIRDMEEQDVAKADFISDHMYNSQYRKPTQPVCNAIEAHEL